MAFEWYASDDATPAGTSNDLTTTAGSASAVVELHGWLNKGSSVGSPETRHLTVYVEDPAAPGTYKTSGLDILDRREFEIRIVGSQNPDVVPGFSVATTAWIPVGSYRPFPAVTWYPNCCVEYEVRVNPSYEGGASSPATYYVRAVTGTTTTAWSIPDDVTVTGNIDMNGFGFTDAILINTLDANSQRITGLPTPVTASDGSDAVPLTYVRGLPLKSPVRCIGDPEVVWADVVSNGDFATVLTPWTGTNWAQAAGKAAHTAGATAALTQDVTIVSGVRYKLTCTVGGTVGSVTPSIGAVAGAVIPFSAGTTEQIIIAGASGTLALAFTPTSDFDGDIDDVFCTATLTGLPTMDGVTPDPNDRVLLPMQADRAECGKWIVSGTGPWTRHPDCAAAYFLYQGVELWCREGTTWAKSKWVQTAAVADLETDLQVWELAYQIP